MQINVVEYMYDFLVKNPKISNETEQESKLVLLSFCFSGKLVQLLDLFDICSLTDSRDLEMIYKIHKTFTKYLTHDVKR